MRKRDYYRAAMNIARQDPAWLHRVIAAAENGDAYLRPIHIAIIRLALRNA